MNQCVLTIVDSAAQSGELHRALVNLDLTVEAADPAAALKCARDKRPVLIVACFTTVDVGALNLCHLLHAEANTPFIVVTDDVGETVEIAILDAGADDVIGRPVSTAALRARVRAGLRRARSTRGATPVTAGPFHIDFDERRVRVRGQVVRLTPKEFDLFTFMAQHPNRVLPHRTLLGAVWGAASEDQSEYLRVFVGQLRKKLEVDPPNPCHLLTEPWVGYRFNPDGPNA